MLQVSGISKTCRMCSLDLPRSRFHAHKKNRDGLRGECKTCSNVFARNWRRANPDKARHNKQMAYWRDKNKRSVKDSKLRASYGIGLTQFEGMLSSQGDACAICGTPETRLSTVGGKRALCVDHCHETGMVRGLVCAGCNSGLGHLRDDPDLLRRAASYIEKHLAANMMVA